MVAMEDARVQDLEGKIRQCKRAFEEFRRRIRRSPTRAWLECVADLDRDDLPRLDGGSPLDAKLALKVQPFQLIAVADAALRFSNDQLRSNPVSFADYCRATSLYLESDYRVFELAMQAGEQPYWYYAFLSMGEEQFSRGAIHPVHAIAQTCGLYGPWNDRFQLVTGLSLSHFAAITFALIAQRMARPRQPFLSLSALTSTDVPYMTDEAVCAYMRAFSASPARYKEESAPYTARFAFKRLWQYPVVDYDGVYIAPSRTCLWESLLMAPHHAVLNSYEGSARTQYLIELGGAFQTYVEGLFRDAGYEPIGCDELVDGATPRAEFVLDVGGGVIVECKRFTFRRDTLVAGTLSDIQESYERLVEGFVQIESTMKHWKGASIGIIVVHSLVPVVNAPELYSMVARSGHATGSRQIIVASLGEVEVLAGMEPSAMWSILDEFVSRADSDKGNISNFIARHHPEVGGRNVMLASRSDDLLNERLGTGTSASS